MATIKVRFRASSVAGKEGGLFYQVIHKRVVRQINPGYKIYGQEWDKSLSAMVMPADLPPFRREYLSALQEKVRSDVDSLRRIVARLDTSCRDYSADDVAEMYRDCAKSRMIAFSRSLISHLKQNGKDRTAETYICVLNSFVRFRNGNDILLDEVTPQLMVEYEDYLRNTGVCPNTSSFYMRNLRAIYNRAVEKGLTEQRNPFRYVYTGIGKTVKRAVPLTTIRLIRDLDLSSNPAADYARDIFMFSFYTRGMSFVDMAFLKKSDLHNGSISYNRQKTNQRLSIKWERPMQEIVDKYGVTSSPYLLPIIRNIGENEWRQYKNAVHLVNVKLKKIGVELGLPIPLTTYVARHAWASIAKSKNIPIATISEAMGHDSEKTTRIYLASLDTSVIDDANRLIIESI